VRETDGLSANEISFDQQNFYNEQFVSGIEQKIMSKLKTDLAVKVENISLQFADQLLNNSLEMDRLHKLLIIRPTTSELQQVVLNLQTMEENSTKQIQSVYHTLQSRIKDSISTEMVQLLNELKTHQQHSNEKMEVISKLISNYSRELEEIQRNEQRSMQMLESTIASNKNDLLRGTEELRSIISQQIEEKFSFNQTSQDRLVAELRQLHDEIRDERERSQLQLSQLDGKVATEQAKLKNEIRDINDSIHTTATSLASLDNEVHLVKNGLKMEAAENKSFRGETDDALIQQKLSIRDLQNTLKEFQALDLFTRVPKLEDHTLRLAAEISQVASALTTLTNTEVRSLLERSQQLEEQVQVVLPKLIQSESIRITSLIKDFEVMASNQTIFNNRMADAEELLNNLLPLQNKFKLLNEKCEKLESDVQSCRSLVESSIDANSEIIRRIEDMEEKFESLDELISSRMNSIRDTLMETLLEKQYETASMMKNVKDNLEMISMAGENVPAAPTAPPPTAKVSRMASNVGKNFVSDGNDGPAPTASRGVSAVMAMPKRQASYRRPTISGAMVTGNSMGPENNNNNNNMGSHFHHQPPSNTPSIMMSDSFSTGQNTPRTHSNDDVISASSFAGKPAPLKKDLGRAINAIGNNNNSRPARLSRVVSGRSEDSSISSPRRDDEQLQPEQDDNEHVSGFDDDVFNHFMDNYNPAATSASVVEGGGSLLENSEFGPAGLQQPSVTSAASQQKNAVGKASVAPKKQKKPTSATASSGSHHPLSSSRTSSPPSSQLAALPLQQSAVPTSLQTRSDVLAVDFSRLVHESQGEGFAYLAESQFLADLCINYEEISTKKKRISNVPPVLCRSLLEVAQRMAESIANSSDFEMVEMVLARIIDENVHHLADIQYDETFVITRRQQKLGQCLEAIQRIIGSYYQASHVSATGAVRNDARHVFLTMVRKALELFLTKHNQVTLLNPRSPSSPSLTLSCFPFRADPRGRQFAPGPHQDSLLHRLRQAAHREGTNPNTLALTLLPLTSPSRPSDSSGGQSVPDTFARGQPGQPGRVGARRRIR
jgi:hypothetical protein